jgi:death on curing protein
MVKYLTVLDVIAIHQEIMSRARQEALLRDEGGLESAVMRPQMSAHYGEADLIEQAAELIVGIALAHAFVDGNKRTATIAGATFLALNGLGVQYEGVEFAEQVEAVVNRHDSLDAATERFVAWLRPHMRTLS